MESFLVSLKEAVEKQVRETVEKTVLTTVRAKLEEFAKQLATEGKVSAEEVMSVWDKMNPDVPAVSVSAATKTVTPRLKTDKNVRCDVKKKTGAHAGEACGKPAVVGCTTCTAHTADDVKAKIRAAQGGVSPSAPSAASDEKKDGPAPAVVESAKVEGCAHKLVTGPRKDSNCGKPVVVGQSYCKTHVDKYPKNQ